MSLSLEQLESRLLLSKTITEPLDFSGGNVPIYYFDKTITFWDLNGGPWYIPGTPYGISSFDTSLEAKAWASTGTISLDFDGSLRITVPDSVQPGQKKVPITLSSSLSSGTMTSKLGAGFDIPLNFAMAYSLPYPLPDGTLEFTTNLEDWLPYLGIPVPNDIGWGTTKFISPDFGSYSTISNSDELLDFDIDLVKIASLMPPPVGITAAAIDPFIDTNIGVDVDFGAKNN